MLPAFQPFVPGSKQKEKGKGGGSASEGLARRHRYLRLTPRTQVKPQPRCDGLQL